MPILLGSHSAAACPMALSIIGTLLGELDSARRASAARILALGWPVREGCLPVLRYVVKRVRPAPRFTAQAVIKVRS